MLKTTHYTVTACAPLSFSNSILKTNTKTYKVPEFAFPFHFWPTEGESLQFPLKLPVVIININANYFLNLRREASGDSIIEAENVCASGQNNRYNNSWRVQKKGEQS